MAMTLFTGRPGSGKSYRIVCRLQQECGRYYVFHNIDGLKHDFFEDGKYIRRWDDIPGFLTLAKQKELAAYCQEEFKRPMLVVIDEANMHGFGVRNGPLLDWISYHRHIGQDIFLVSQSANSINRDFVDRCQFEVRAKRGVATNMFLYQYMVGDEVWKTDRVPIRKAVFSMYDSFVVRGGKGTRSRIGLWAVACVVVAVCLGAYQVAFGIPRLFSRSGGLVKPAAVAVLPATAPVAAPVRAAEVPTASARVDLVGYSLATVMGSEVWVQKRGGGSLVPLGEVLPGYVFIQAMGGGVRVCDAKGRLVDICRRRVTSEVSPAEVASAAAPVEPRNFGEGSVSGYHIGDHTLHGRGGR